MTNEEFNNLSKEEQKKVPYGQRPFGQKVGGAIFLVLIILIPALTIRSCNEKNDHPTNEQAYKIGCEFVREQLKAPTSAIFPEADYTVMIEDDKQTYNITSYVDAQNSFGALLRLKYHIRLHYNGVVASQKENWTLLEYKTIE